MMGSLADRDQEDTLPVEGEGEGVERILVTQNFNS